MVEMQRQIFIDKHTQRHVTEIFASFPKLNHVEERQFDWVYLKTCKDPRLAHFMRLLPVRDILDWWDTGGDGYEDRRNEIFKPDTHIWGDALLDASMTLPRFLSLVNPRLSSLSCNLTIFRTSGRATATTRELLEDTLGTIHKAQFPTLSSCQLVIGGDMEIHRLLAAVNNMVRSMVRLKDFDFTMHCSHVEDNIRQDNLQEISRIGLRRLHVLRLSCSTAKNSLLALLNSSQTTLKSLKLDTMFMSNGSGDWNSFLKEMPRLPSLCTLDLRDLYDEDNWTAIPESNSRAYCESPSKDAIETLRSYLVGGGEVPSLRLQDYDERSPSPTATT